MQTIYKVEQDKMLQNSLILKKEFKSQYKKNSSNKQYNQ